MWGHAFITQVRWLAFLPQPLPPCSMPVACWREEPRAWSCVFQLWAPLCAVTWRGTITWWSRLLEIFQYFSRALRTAHCPAAAFLRFSDEFTVCPRVTGASGHYNVKKLPLILRNAPQWRVYLHWERFRSGKWKQFREENFWIDHIVTVGTDRSHCDSGDGVNRATAVFLLSSCLWHCKLHHYCYAPWFIHLSISLMSELRPLTLILLASMYLLNFVILFYCC